MILEEDSIPLLQAYLIRTLEPICAAEPSVLASYVIALLQNEKPKEELQTFCEEELQDFLKGETSDFVKKLFKVLKEEKSGKYSLIEDKEASVAPSSIRKRSNEEKESLHSKLLGNNSNTISKSLSVVTSTSVADPDPKRRKVDSSHSPSPSSYSTSNEENTPSKKFDSKEETKAAEEFTKSLKHVEEYVPTSPSIQLPSSLNYERDSRGKRKYERERERGDRSLDRGDRDKHHHSYRDRERSTRDRERKDRPREKCRDYEERGFCVRGELCNYDHGSDKIIIPGISNNANQGTSSNVTSESSAIYSSNSSTSKMEIDSVPLSTYSIPYLNASIGNNSKETTNGMNSSSDAISIPLYMNNGNSAADTTTFMGNMGGVGNSNIGMIPSVANISSMNSFLPSGVVVNPMHAMLDSIISRVEDDEDANIIQVGGKGMYNPNFKYLVSNNNNVPSSQNTPSLSLSHSNSSSNSNEYNPRFNREREKEKSKEGTTSDGKNESLIDNTTLVISNIPEELLVHSFDKLSSHFSKFGEVLNVQVKAHLKKAFVKFKDPLDAQKAFDSPEAVLGNRFIRISWAKRQHLNRQKHSSSSAPADPISVPPPLSVTSSYDSFKKPKKPRLVPTSNGANSTSASVSETTPGNSGTNTGIANNNNNNVAAEKVKKLKKQKEEIRKLQIEQTKEMLEKLSKSNIDASQKAAIIKRLLSVTDSLSSSIAKDKESASTSTVTNSHVASTSTSAVHDSLSKKELKPELLDKELDAYFSTAPRDSSTSSDSSSPPPSQKSAEESGSKSTTLEKLKKKYASLQKMAASMGLSPSTSTSSTPSSFPQKRKSFPPKFAKPSNNNNVSRVMDNRTTSLLIRVPVTPPTQVSDESLHAHFRTFGEISKFKKLPISTNSSAAYLLQFSTRRNAEHAMNKGKVFNGQTVQMAWYENKATTSTKVEEKTQKEQSSPIEPINSSMEIEGNSNDGIDEDTENEETDRSWKH